MRCNPSARPEAKRLSTQPPDPAPPNPSSAPVPGDRRRSSMAAAAAAPAASPAAAASSPPAQVVANAFVHQYYHILHSSPQFVFRFYHEESKLGRPDAATGEMISISGMEAINQKIVSMDYSEIKAEIKTVDAQESLAGGVTVLVTGYLTGKDEVRRNFTQSFFLAPQDKGYYVLNDIFRSVDDAEAVAPAASAPEMETQPPPEAQVTERSLPPPQLEEEEYDDGEVDEEDDEVIDEELFNPSDHEQDLTVEEEIPVEEVINEVPIQNSSPPVVAESNVPVAVPEEAPKKSYASIVKVKKEFVAPPPHPVPAPARPPPAKTERQAAPAQVQAPTPDAPAASSNSTETSSIQEAEVDSHSVYIKNLPLNATPAQLEEEFKKFGAIKVNGIQVRSHKQGFCFGFVEFEAASAVQSAIEASPVSIGGRPAYVEEKRPAGSRVSNRGRFLPGRGAFWNEGVRGRGGSFGGRGYGRSDYGNRVDFGGRGGGRGGVSNRGGEGGYQRVDGMGPSGGRGNRSGSMAANGPSRTFAPRVPAPA